jgi:hypothetical protein
MDKYKPVSTEPQPIHKYGNKGLRERPVSRIPTKEYKDGWERIWGKK